MSEQDNKPASPGAPEPAKPLSEQTLNVRPWASFDDFSKIDLRVAKVLTAQPHPNADKLLVLQVDLGDHQRQIIAGIRKDYAPEALVGKLIVVVANLQPRRMRGLDSNGMLLAASSGDGEDRKVVILTTDSPVPPGSPVS
ncbi:MAG: methionine--tRNA ligase subunit beta [Planctomycetes bacterium]|nr:methionine--tRNA ligase subunit beta [Planctomycetota bacterium]